MALPIFSPTKHKEDGFILRASLLTELISFTYLEGILPLIAPIFQKINILATLFSIMGSLKIAILV